MLSFGFAAGSDRSLQAFLERYVEMADCDELSYASFHEWFEPGFVALLREILDDAIENLDPDRNDLRGRLEPLDPEAVHQDESTDRSGSRKPPLPPRSGR
ncbi:MAG: hypothetical protein ACI9YT_000125 [Halobacteriales archaeon]|jgi:hypothetical protein